MNWLVDELALTFIFSRELCQTLLLSSGFFQWKLCSNDSQHTLFYSQFVVDISWKSNTGKF